MITYSEKIIHYFENSNYSGEFATGLTNVYTGKAGDERNGDVVQIQLQIKDNKIIDTKFKAYGTVVTIAITAWLAEFVIGKTLEQIQSITTESIASALELSNLRIHSALLVIAALKQATTF